MICDLSLCPYCLKVEQMVQSAAQMSIFDAPESLFHSRSALTRLFPCKNSCSLHGRLAGVYAPCFFSPCSAGKRRRESKSVVAKRIKVSCSVLKEGQEILSRREVKIHKGEHDR